MNKDDQLTIVENIKERNRLHKLKSLTAAEFINQKPDLDLFLKLSKLAYDLIDIKHKIYSFENIKVFNDILKLSAAIDLEYISLKRSKKGWPMVSIKEEE